VVPTIKVEAFVLVGAWYGGSSYVINHWIFDKSGRSGTR